MSFKKIYRFFKRFVDYILFSNLTILIVILNLVALIILMTGIMILNQFRDALVDARIDSLATQGKIIAGAIAASATLETHKILIDPEKILELQAGQSVNANADSSDYLDFPIDPERVAPLIRRVISPKSTRARIYDSDANLIVDSRQLYASGQVSSYELTSLNQNTMSLGQKILRWFSKKFFDDPIEDKGIVTTNGSTYPEVRQAMNGVSATAQRRNSEGQLVVSVAVPIQRAHAVVGVLLLSTIGSDIDKILHAERLSIFKIFIVVASVMVILSFFLASTIATPLRKLAAAADRVRHGTHHRVEIPDFSYRQDEIGHLSTSIRDMTDALYMRIEAIERFAADVSHELKNPLTSLRSAVETLPLAKSQNSRTKLLNIILHDVQRLDRLITDISDASRLDSELAREEASEVNLKTLLENIITAEREVKKGKLNANIQLKIEPLSHHMHYSVSGHDLRLGQVISNLIDNARSFVPEKDGKIFIHMYLEKANVIITVEDNGPGVGVDNIERIFERFYTDRPAIEAFGNNSGLGLSISRQIIEAHDGQLLVENILDKNREIKGARFIIILPVLEKITLNEKNV